MEVESNFKDFLDDEFKRWAAAILSVVWNISRREIAKKT